MDSYERGKIADVLKDQEFQHGDFVIKEGESGDCMYFIVEGDAFASKILIPGKASSKVMSYKKGDYFGEMALLKNEPWAANVIAKTKLVTCSIDRHSFKRLCGSIEDLLTWNMSLYEKLIAGADADEED